MTARPWYCALLLFSLTAGDWATLRCVADELTDARIIALPEPERGVWQAYLKRSREHAEAEVQALATEVKAVSVQQAARAPQGGDFKLAHKAGDSWYASESVVPLARTIISYQTPTGGWSKHISYEKGPRPVGTQWTSQSEPGKRPHYQATFDNRSTTEQLHFLANVERAEIVRECQQAFRKGLQYVLTAQYPCGGWPQVYPLEGDYHDNITFNDDAQVHILELLVRIESERERFSFLSDAERAAVGDALAHGIQCLLKTQVRQKGRLAVWCAQHDPLTLEPASARSLEPASFSGSESAHVLQWLMRLERPNQEVVQAIEAGLDWLDRVKVTGLERVSMEGKISYRANPDSEEIYWARFYDLETHRPIFPGRDGKIYNNYAEMAANNKVGYDYLSTRPGSILKNGQKQWRRQLSGT